MMLTRHDLWSGPLGTIFRALCRFFKNVMIINKIVIIMLVIVIIIIIIIIIIGDIYIVRGYI